MNLKTSKRVLKVTGVIMIIGAILNLLIGSLGLAGGIYAANAPVIQADETLALGILVAANTVRKANKGIIAA